MPQRDICLLLRDVLDACGLISRCAAGKQLKEYIGDVIVRSAVERQFEIIGEAMRRILEVEAGLSLRLPEAREVIEFRNFLSHGYHLVDHAKVWKIIQNDVPQLQARVQAILDERA